MKAKTAGLFTAMVLGLGLSTSANAILIDRGNGMIYDTDQNLTWLQDANYAATSGYATVNAVDNGGTATDNIFADGRMGWDAAMSWAAGLSYGGYNDWRLPSITDFGNDDCNWSYDGSDCGYNVDTSGSEMAYMWQENLGNVPVFDVRADYVPGSGLTSASADGVAILNLQADIYWSGTESFSGGKSYFNMLDGSQVQSSGSAEYFAWAVRTGDVGAAPVPAPAMLLLLAVGLVGIAGVRRRRG